MKDVVTCLLDLDEGTMTFLLNGVDLGVAFKNIDRGRCWYPAVSLTTDEWGSFRFGSVLDPMVFCPDGYACIPASQYSPTLVVSPPSLVDEHIPEVEDPVRGFTFPLIIPPLASYYDPDVELSFYFEVQVGLRGLDCALCPIVGVVSDTGNIVAAVFDISTNRIAFMKFTEFMQKSATFDVFLVEQVTTFERVMNGQTLDGVGMCQIMDVDVVRLEEGAYVGVGVDSVSKMVFFTFQGKTIGAEYAATDGGSFVPYLRNLPRFLFNFSQFDFKHDRANFCFSPKTC